MPLDDAAHAPDGDVLSGSGILGVVEAAQRCRAWRTLFALPAAGATPAAVLPSRALAEQVVHAPAFHASTVRCVSRRQRDKAAPAPLSCGPLPVQPGRRLSQVGLSADRPS